MSFRLPFPICRHRRIVRPWRHPGTKRSVPGFTLAELLIALAILGVIATFTIPKVLQGQQNEQKKSVFRETIAALNQIVYTGSLTQDMSGVTTGPALRDYLTQRLNHTRKCANSISEGCTAITNIATCQDTWGFVLHNGAVIYEVEGPSTNAQGGCWRDLCIDYNGPKGPNLRGEDVFKVTIYWGTAPEAGNMPGTVKPNANSQDIAAYNWVFSN